jgi:hypothetical protein
LFKLEYFKFQPFESRKGKDEVYAVRLRGHHYHDVTLFKSVLRVNEHLAKARGTLTGPNAGGWLPQYHRWFVEPIVWRAIKEFYETIGIPVKRVRRLPDGQLKLEGIKSQRQQYLKVYGDPEPTTAQIIEHASARLGQ